jgi:hypothetical protein
MPPENEPILNNDCLYMFDKNDNMINVGKLKNINLIQVNEITLAFKKYLKRVKNRNKLYSKLKKLGR